MCVSVTRGTPTHTANAHHVGDVVVSFFLSVIIGSLQIVQSIAAVAVRAHCAAHDHQILGATTATPFDTTALCVHQLRSWRAVGSGTRPRTSCRTTDCRGNWTRAQSAEKRDTSALGAHGSGP